MSVDRLRGLITDTCPITRPLTSYEIFNECKADEDACRGTRRFSQEVLYERLWVKHQPEDSANHDDGNKSCGGSSPHLLSYLDTLRSRESVSDQYPVMNVDWRAPKRRQRASQAAELDQEVRNTAVAAHLSTFAGLAVPFGSVIGPLAVWLTRRQRHPFIDQAGREALNFGISIAIYGLVALVAALMLVGIPLLIGGVITWVVLASLAAVRASQGRS